MTTSKEIDDIAARWAARTDRGPLSPGEQIELDGWLSTDPRHFGAFAKAQAVLLHTERARALGPDFDPARFSETDARNWMTQRRAMLAGSAAAAAAIVAGAVILPRFHTASADRLFATERGQTRTVTLGDGSIITLNTASQVIVSYTPQQRGVTLVAGEALFDVAKDRSRPFIVQTGIAAVRAVGTSFSVALLPQQPMTVLVQEGVVELNPTMIAGRAPLRLPANMRAVVPAGAPIRTVALTAEDVDRELMWRQGRIAFEGNSLADAAAVFARYSSTRIVIRDQSLAGETITGLFVANDPVGFSKAVALSLGLQLRIGENQVELSR